MAQSDRAPIEIIARGILTSGNRILLCRNVAKGYHYLPGGHVEPGEAAADALVREFEEECGLRLRPGRCALITEQRFHDGKVHRHEYSIVFHVEHVGAPLPDPVESREADIAFDWVDLAAIADTDLRPAAIRAWLASGEGGSDDHADWISDRE